ncbi:MAG TPA: hypothetical protein V6D18_06980 [Thermosynechococcaceae cyanobacterium]
MSSPNNPNRQEKIREQEQLARLRKLEAEINQTPATKPQEPRRSLQQLRKAIEVAKFFGIVIAIIVSLQFGLWLVQMILIGGVAWVIYKLLFSDDRSNL